MGKPTHTIRNVLAGFIAASTLLLTGCEFTNSTTSGKTETEASDAVLKELQQNDYRGGVMRTLALKDSVIGIMDGMKANNTIIRQDNPNSYWTTDGYQDFVSTFLSAAIINDTQWFNEEEVPWETILAQIVATQNSFVNVTNDGISLKSGVSIVRNEKDDYGVLNVPTSFGISLGNNNYSVSDKKANYRVLYDCDKDWCKAYASVQIDNVIASPSALELFEYQRINNDVFIVQTSKERLMVVLAPVEADTDIRQREVKEFYYSKLVSNGFRTTFEPFELLPEVDQISNTALSQNVKINETMTGTFPYANMDGDLCDRYGTNDSMFYRLPTEITRDWVFEDKALQQGIVYKDGVLVVTTYNKLSTFYERFIYSMADADTSGLSELEDLVEIENLIGVQYVETQKPETPTDNTGNSTASTPAQSDPTSGASETDTSDVSDTTSDTTESQDIEPNETSVTEGE